MRKLIKCLALLILSALLIFNVNPLGQPGGEAARAEVCIGPAALLTYFRNPPSPLLSGEIVEVLEGTVAQEFMNQTGGASIAPFVGFVYFFSAPDEWPNKLFALAADAEGCAIRRSGARASDPSKSVGLPLQPWKLEQFLRGLSLGTETPKAEGLGI